MGNDEIRIAKNCAYNILDNLQAIITELNNINPYEGYLNEKLGHIKNDVDALDYQINKEDY